MFSADQQGQGRRGSVALALSVRLTRKLGPHCWALYCCIRSRYHQQRAQANEHFELCTSRTYQLMDQVVTRMMLELDSAGNVRLEVCEGV